MYDHVVLQLHPSVSLRTNVKHCVQSLNITLWEGVEQLVEKLMRVELQNFLVAHSHFDR